jgi:BMFP domain-containing protein YqiC
MEFEIIRDFYLSLKKIEKNNILVNDKIDKLKQEIELFSNNIQKLNIDEKLKKNNEVFANFLLFLKESFKEWKENFKRLAEEEKFRSELENYFIVMVFGKVKAGKSSLGNFIANHRLKNDKVNFFRYDKAGNKYSIKKLEEINEDKFAVDNLECTNEIQGFKLGGMAWIDTPGLGSMTKENEALAKKYINAADFIIYLTSSDSPMQADEIEEIKELLSYKKSIRVYITKSDKKIIKKDENGKIVKENGRPVRIRVNKSDEDRKKQEEWVKSQIEKIVKDKNLLKGVFSISTKTAEEGLSTNNIDLVKQSNILDFYKEMIKIIKNSSKLKKETSINRIDAFIDVNINKQIKNIKNKMEYLQNNIEKNLKKLDTLSENTISDIKLEINFIVSQYENEIDKYNSQKVFQQIENQIHKEIKNILLNFENEIKNIFKDFNLEFNNLLNTITNKEEFEIKDIYKTFTYSTLNRNKNIGAAIGGTIGTIGGGILAGIFTGGSGTVIGGTIGSTIGGTVGGVIGGFIGKLTSDEITEYIKVGDNKEEVILRFKEKEIKIYKNIIKNSIYEVKKSFFGPTKNVLEKIENQLNSLEKSINTIKNQLIKEKND